MTTRQKIAETTMLQKFYSLPETRCPYYAHLKERKLMTVLKGVSASAQMDTLVARGFRRMREFAFIPDCPTCRACIAYRLPVMQFRPSRQQKRVARTHADLIVSCAPPIATEEQFELFQAYQRRRHEGGTMQTIGISAYRGIVEVNPVHSGVLEIRHKSGQLVCAALYDVLARSISATYSFYATDVPRRSYGIFAILQLIALCRSRGLSHLYLGHWIAGHPKMAYKQKFQSAEVLHDEAWILYDEATRQNAVDALKSG